MDAGGFAVDRPHRWNGGLLSLSRRGRSTGRDQFAVAVVWDLESAAGGGGLGGGYDNLAENGTTAVGLGDSSAYGLAGDCHDDRKLPEDFCRRSSHRISFVREHIGGADCGGEDPGGEGRRYAAV